MSLPKDLDALLSPTGKREDSDWYKAQQRVIEAEFDNTIARLQKARERQVKASETQARFLFAFAALAEVLILLAQFHVLLISLIVTLPLVTLGFIYQVYASLIAQSAMQKIALAGVEKAHLISKIEPTEKDVINAFRQYEQREKIQGHTFHLYDGSLLNINPQAASVVSNQLSKLRNIRMEWAKQVKCEQCMMSSVLLHNDKHTFWGVDKVALQKSSEEVLSSIVPIISLSLINDSCTYWYVMSVESDAKTACGLIEQHIPEANTVNLSMQPSAKLSSKH